MSESPTPNAASDEPSPIHESDSVMHGDCGDLTDPTNELAGSFAGRSPGELDDEQMARIAKAIADPQRFAILCSISKQDEMPCKTLVSELPITQATISHHLKELVAAGLIRSRRQGQMAILSCRRDVCRAYVDMLTRRLTP
tara:strand:- start:145612 stop:146034 length:423 start_codon:yes stop_codon:yes gene_type:complete